MVGARASGAIDPNLAIAALAKTPSEDLTNERKLY